MRQPLRVLQVVGKMDRAGAETLLMNLYRHIDRSRVQFDFLTHRDDAGDYDAEITDLGGTVYHVCPMSLKNGLRYPQALKAFFENRPGYRIIHSHIDAMSALPLGAAKRAGVPVRIAHSHNTAFPRDGKYPIRLLARQLLPLVATHCFSCSDAAAGFLFPKKTMENGSYAVLPNAIELERFAFSPSIRAAKRQELEIGSETFVVGHVGRFCMQKNHDKLLHIFAVLHQRRPDSILFLVGQGELKNKISALSTQLGIENSVHFLGVRNDVERLMQAFDLFLLPSLYEGFPVVGVEAQAAGLPCLMSDRIKSDVALTDPVVFVPLEADDALWAQRAEELFTCCRESTTEKLAAQGFDIKKQASFLEDFYLNVSKGYESGAI